MCSRPTESEGKCPICDAKRVDKFEKPIQYWGCGKCGTVIVMDDDGILSILSVHVQYKP